MPKKKSKNLKLITTKVNPVLPKATTEQAIVAFYIKGETYSKLTPKQDDIRVKIEEAYSKLIEGYSIDQVARMMKQLHKCSLGSAYNWVNMALRVFGDINKSNTEGVRHVLYEYSMKCFQLASQMKPPDVKSMNSAVSNMIKLKGLDRDTIDKPAVEDIQPPDVMLGEFIEELNENMPSDLKERVQILISNDSDQRVKLSDIPEADEVDE